jgi:hypothetical protein
MALENNPYMKRLIRAVRKHADLAGDGHPGWAAIADNWDDTGISDTICHAVCTTEEQAIAACQRAANDILAKVMP